MREMTDDEKEKTLTLRRDKSIAKDQKKLEEMRKKLHTDDERTSVYVTHVTGRRGQRKVLMYIIHTQGVGHTDDERTSVSVTCVTRGRGQRKVGMSVHIIQVQGVGARGKC